MSDAPPRVPNSPQQAPLNASSAAGTTASMQVNATLTVQMLHAVSINREKLSEWHHKIRSRVFPLVSGFYVRCRIEDANDGRALYKVGRVRNLKSDWSVELDLLTTDETRSGKSHTNYDCISNTKLTDVEFNAWAQKLPPEAVEQILANVYRAEERMRMIETILLTEPAFHAKKKADEKKTATPNPAEGGGIDSTLPERYVFSHNVLLVDDNDDLPVTTTIMDIIANAVGVKGVSEPDTPRALADPNNRLKARGFEEAVASNSTMVSLSDVKNYIQSPSAPLPDPAKVIDTLRRSANAAWTEFRYDNIAEFAKACLSVCRLARDIVSKEPLYLHLRSPMVVFGDIHGNFPDMMFFLNKVIAFDDIMLKYTTSNLLFLGDYVDRGPHGVECIMYLLALKCIAPKKVSLLRGNHESPEVNGDVDVYGYSSFKYQCFERFGREKGMELWIAINEVFQFLPVIANIDKKIFCVHGGLPQYTGGDDRRLEVLADPSFPRVPVVQCNDMSNVAQRMIVNDLLWSDPAAPGAPVDQFGFGPNPRGPDIKTFGARAVDMFCERYGFQYIFRAHQEKADGLRVSDNARVVTIFSTSDYAGHQNGAGCVLVNEGKIRMAIKKPRTQLADPPGRGQSPRRGLSPKRK
jgi:protein phosphatase